MKPEPADATSTIEDIDTSSLASLEAVRVQESAVRQLVQKAVEKKQSVSPGVFSERWLSIFMSAPPRPLRSWPLATMVALRAAASSASKRTVPL